jgi:hypothetical protein
LVPGAGDDESEIVLTRLEKVRGLLAEVRTVPQAKDAVAAAKAVEIYARETKASAAILGLAFRFRSLAKRRLGEVVVQEKAAGRLREGRPEKTVLGEDRFSLADLGISKNESAQAQEFASVSEEAFERMLGEAGSGELSDKALLRQIRAAKAEGRSPKKAAPDRKNRSELSPENKKSESPPPGREPELPPEGSKKELSEEEKAMVPECVTLIGSISVATYAELYPSIEASVEDIMDTHRTVMRQHLELEKGGSEACLLRAADLIVRGSLRLSLEFGNRISEVPEIEEGLARAEKELRAIAERLTDYAELVRARKD